MDRFNVGIIGCGNIFPIHAYSLKAIENVKIAAVCDIDEQKVKKSASEFGCEYFTDYKLMIDSGLIDSVHICTPHYIHCEMAVYALSKGLNVITEKPMGIDFKSGDLMMEAAKKSNGEFGVIFQNRHNAGSIFAKKAVEENKIGKIIGAKVIVTWHRDEDYYNSASWRGTLAYEGGGVIINQAIHSLDLARWIINSDVTEVRGSTDNLCHPNIEVEDNASGLILFENGVKLCYYTTNNYTTNDKIEVVIHGENGIISIIGDEVVITYNDGTKEVSQKDETEVVFSDMGKSYWGVSHYKQIRAFYNSIKNNIYDNSADEGYKTHKMIMMLYASSRKGKV